MAPGRPGRIDIGGRTVLSAEGVHLLSEPGDTGRVTWGVANARQELNVIVRRLPPIRGEGRVPIPALGYAPSGPKLHPPVTLSPSQVVGTADVGEILQIGQRIRIAIGDEDEMRRFGDAVHHFLAADRPSMPVTERNALASEILGRFGVREAVDASELPKASSRLSQWIATTWPGATWRREWSLLQKLPGGTILQGIADLVIEADPGLVLLDHKSFPGSREHATTRAVQYAG